MTQLTKEERHALAARVRLGETYRPNPLTYDWQNHSSWWKYTGPEGLSVEVLDTFIGAKWAAKDNRDTDVSKAILEWLEAE